MANPLMQGVRLPPQWGPAGPLLKAFLKRLLTGVPRQGFSDSQPGLWPADELAHSLAHSLTVSLAHSLARRRAHSLAHRRAGICLNYVG